MKQSPRRLFIAASLLAIMGILAAAVEAQGQTFRLGAQTAGTNKIDLGFFKGGSIFALQLSGQVSLGNQWDTWADGSLVSPITDENYTYGNVGAPCYPKTNGGDGINHFVGGGANFDVLSRCYGLAGLETTDTSAQGTLRFGAVIGTFCSAPQRGDWFYVGLSNVLTIPTNGGHLYLAVNDSYHLNNCGEYIVTLKMLYPPLLTLRKTPTCSVLTWYASGSNFVLETTSALVQPPVWRTVTNPPVLLGDTLTVTIDAPPDFSLYRLREQEP
jgi:hypothetical protein